MSYNVKKLLMVECQVLHSFVPVLLCWITDALLTLIVTLAYHHIAQHHVPSPQKVVWTLILKMFNSGSFLFHFNLYFSF